MKTTTSPAPQPIIDEVIAGLRDPIKHLPCKLLYDARGAELFERICEVDDYYPTRNELALLDATSEIGIGLSPGDKYYAEPYLYVTPYPIAKDARFPELPGGIWRREGWTGAVLRGSEIAAGADPHGFLRAAVEAGRIVITG